jgi:hypothetical protein
MRSSFQIHGSLLDFVALRPGHSQLSYFFFKVSLHIGLFGDIFALANGGASPQKEEPSFEL